MVQKNYPEIAIDKALNIELEFLLEFFTGVVLSQGVLNSHYIYLLGVKVGKEKNIYTYFDNSIHISIF